MVPLARGAASRGSFLSGGPFGFVILDDPARAADAAAALDALPGLEAWPSDADPGARSTTADPAAPATSSCSPSRRSGSAAASLLLDLRFALGRSLRAARPAPTATTRRPCPRWAAIFLALGRGVTGRARARPVRALDVAPTAARLLGIAKPRDCEGAAIEAIGAGGARRRDRAACPGVATLPSREDAMRRDFFTEEHELFRAQVRRFVEKEIEPKIAEWNARGMSDRETWQRAGEEGFLGAVRARGVRRRRRRLPLRRDRHGGARAALRAHGADDRRCTPTSSCRTSRTFGSEEQKQKWLPGAIRGEIAARHRA